MILVVVMYAFIYVYVGRQNGSLTFFGLFKQYKPWETVVSPTKNSTQDEPPRSEDLDGTSGRRFPSLSVARTKLRLDTSGVTNDTLSPTEPTFLTSVLPEVCSVGHGRKVSDGTTLVSHASLEFAHTKPVLVSPEYGDNEKPTILDLEDGNYDGPDERKRSVFSRVSERFTRSPTSPTDNAPSPLLSVAPQLMGKKIMTKHMRKRQDAIQRQLGLLFLYPLCYFITYIPPFVAHAMNYTDYYVQHPVVWLNILNFACLASLGWVDALVFSLRERPWRHIPGSTGTFWGSFRFWDNKNTRRTSDDSVADTGLDTGNTAPGSRRGSQRPVSHHNDVMRSRDHITPITASTPDQRDSWIVAPQPNDQNVGPGITECRSLRVPSWSHFRSNSTVLAQGPIMEEGGEVHHATYPGASLTSTSPLQQLHSPLASQGNTRGQRLGSVTSALSSGGSEDSGDRELATMDRMLDQAMLRELSRPER